MIYSPDEDSFLIEKELVKFSKGKKVLDMGSGSGILAQSALNNGASSVLGCDINPESVSLLKKKGIPSIKSDLFSNITGKFDIIVFNPPYLPLDSLEDKESSLITSGGKKGDEIVLKFINKVKSHLNKNGFVILLVSSITPRKRILSLLKRKSLKHHVLSSKKIFFETLEVWALFKQESLKLSYFTSSHE